MNRLINLTFHGVGTATRRLEQGEDDVWVSSEQFRAMLDSAAVRQDIRISFDDGNASDVDEALPALRDRGLSATFFVVAGRVGTSGFLDASGIRELADAGMTIGCHGMRHQPWRKLDDATLHNELVEARRVLEAIVDRPVTQAACPFGSYDRHVLSTLRRCAYVNVYTSDRGTARPRDWLQARNTVRRGDNGTLVEHILAAERGRYHAVRHKARLALKRWR